MSHNPLLIEMVGRQIGEERLKAAEADRLADRVERQQARQRGGLLAALARFLTAAVERQSVTRSVPTVR